MSYKSGNHTQANSYIKCLVCCYYFRIVVIHTHMYMIINTIQNCNARQLIGHKRNIESVRIVLCWDFNWFRTGCYLRNSEKKNKFTKKQSKLEPVRDENKWINVCKHCWAFWFRSRSSVDRTTREDHKNTFSPFCESCVFSIYTLIVHCTELDAVDAVAKPQSLQMR